MKISLDLNAAQISLEGILAPYGCLGNLELVSKVGVDTGKTPPPTPSLVLSQQCPDSEGADLN